MRSGRLFISYKREDVARANTVRLALGTSGFETWWDVNLQTGGEWKADIDEALRAASAVVVLWSQAACNSDWVRHEASIARSLGKLVPVKLEACEPPDIFASAQTADLSHWNGNEKDDKFLNVIAALRALRCKRYRRQIAIAAAFLATAGVSAAVAWTLIPAPPPPPAPVPVTGDAGVIVYSPSTPNEIDYLTCEDVPAVAKIQGDKFLSRLSTTGVENLYEVLSYRTWIEDRDTCWHAVIRRHSFLHFPGVDFSKAYGDPVLNYRSPSLTREKVMIVPPAKETAAGAR